MSGVLADADAARARPLRAWRPAERARIADVVGATLRAWQEAWGISGGDAGAVRCEPPVEATTSRPARDAAGWRPLGDAARGIWRAAPADAPRPTPDASDLAEAASRALFGAPSTAGGAGDAAGIAGELARAAWDDWAARLGAALGGDVVAPSQGGAAPGSDVLGPWSGALAVTLPWCGTSLALLVSGERVARVVGMARPAPAAPPVSVTPLWPALARRPARVRAELHSFELDLGALATLRVGDVVRSTHPLDAPLAVVVGSAERTPAATLCAGFLGMSRGARAVELLPRPAAPRNGAAAPHSAHP